MFVPTIPLTKTHWYHSLTRTCWCFYEPSTCVLLPFAAYTSASLFSMVKFWTRRLEHYVLSCYQWDLVLLESVDIIIHSSFWMRVSLECGTNLLCTWAWWTCLDIGATMEKKLRGPCSFALHTHVANPPLSHSLPLPFATSSHIFDQNTKSVYL